MLWKTFVMSLPCQQLYIKDETNQSTVIDKALMSDNVC